MSEYILGNVPNGHYLIFEHNSPLYRKTKTSELIILGSQGWRKIVKDENLSVSIVDDLGALGKAVSKLNGFID